MLLDSMYCENFGRFHPRKFKKVTNKATSTVKNIRLGNYDSRLKAKILKEMTLKHCVTIAYYM